MSRCLFLLPDAIYHKNKVHTTVTIKCNEGDILPNEKTTDIILINRKNTIRAKQLLIYNIRDAVLASAVMVGQKSKERQTRQTTDLLNISEDFHVRT